MAAPGQCDGMEHVLRGDLHLILFDVLERNPSAEELDVFFTYASPPTSFAPPPPSPIHPHPRPYALCQKNLPAHRATPLVPHGALSLHRLPSPCSMSLNQRRACDLSHSMTDYETSAAISRDEFLASVAVLKGEAPQRSTRNGEWSQPTDCLLASNRSGRVAI